MIKKKIIFERKNVVLNDNKNKYVLSGIDYKNIINIIERFRLICSKPCGDMADVLLSLKHTVPTPQSSVGEQQQHDQVYGLSANHNVSILLYDSVFAWVFEKTLFEYKLPCETRIGRFFFISN